MKTIMSRTPHDASFSFSRRYLNWRKKALENDENDGEILTYNSSSHSFSSAPDPDHGLTLSFPLNTPKKHPLSSKLRSFFVTKAKSPHVLGSKVVGTLFGYRRGHVHIAFQDNPKSNPAFLIEISTHTSVLVREMASGLVRVALECDKKVEKKGVKLLEEPLWRAYCNGKKCGYATRRECTAEEWAVLAAVGPITMGAGVLPGGDRTEIAAEGELMYMRARFERIVGSKDSEAFYMMNPDGHGGPELSVYLLRV